MPKLQTNYLSAYEFVSWDKTDLLQAAVGFAQSEGVVEDCYERDV